MKNKKNKSINKGQISIFIIIAIIIVAIVGIVMVVIKINNNNNSSKDESYALINNCLKNTGEQALYYIGRTGGYYSIPEKSTLYGTTYYFYDKINIMPTKEQVENEISKYIEEMGSVCGVFDNTPYDFVSSGNISSKTVIDDNKVTFDIKYPISIKKSGRTFSYDKFNIEIPARIGILYKASREYINGQVENPYGICINCINDLANKYDIKFITSDYSNDTIIFNLWDNNTKINGEDYYAYTFAAKYNIGEVEVLG